jgi:hypothetical protein
MDSEPAGISEAADCYRAAAPNNLYLATSAITVAAGIRHLALD